MSKYPILPVKYGALILPVIAFFSMLLAISHESDGGITLGRVAFAGTVLFFPCILLIFLSLVYLQCIKNDRVSKEIQYFVFFLFTMLALMAGYYVVQMTNF